MAEGSAEALRAACQRVCQVTAVAGSISMDKGALPPLQRVRWPCLARLFPVLMGLGALCVLAADPKSADLVKQGNAAFKKRDLPGAISFFTQAIAADPSNHIAYYNRGRVHDYEGRFDPALADYNEVLRLQPDYSGCSQLRGALHLRLGHFAEALADFNHYLKLMPKNEPHHWQRGMAFYYLGRYEESRRQFEQCHRVNTNDIEHVLWHFACTARLKGFEAARASLLPAGDDPRPSLEKVYACFAGKIKPQEIFATAKVKDSKDKNANRDLAYAHFYVALFYEVTSNEMLAREHTAKAAELGPKGDLVCDLARAQTERLAAAPPPAAK
jgi:lipoprotein NlpI